MNPGPASDAPLAGWTAIILAAGRGRRMGGPKAIMTVGGLPWWRVQETRLAAAGVPRLWVVSADVERVMRAGPTEAPPLVQANPDAPMFESVRSGISALKVVSDGVFILPVDVPAPARTTWRLVAAHAHEGVAVPTYLGVRGHPAALSPAWCRRVLDRALASDAVYRLDHLIAGDTREVPVDDPAVTVNLNTPDDVESWLSTR